MRAAMTPLLSDDNISKLRANAQQSQQRRFDQPRVPVTFQGGPLLGVKITVMQHEATGPYLGFCVVTQ